MKISSNPFKVKYPPEMQTSRAKKAYWVLWQMHIMDIGRGHIFGKVTGLFGEFFSLILLLDKVGWIALPLWIIVSIAFGGVWCIWFSGALYLMFGFDQINNILIRNRDPMMKNMYDKLKGDVKK